MKQVILFLSVILLTLTGCEKDDPIVEKKFEIDPYATVDIRPDASGWAGLRSTNPDHLSPLEIVEQTTAMQFYNPDIMDHSELWERVFHEDQKDFNPDDPKLMMWGTDIISVDGDIVADFIESKDIILLNFALDEVDAPRDTLGYIPNSVVRAAEAAIKAAYADGDTDAVYDLFHDAFTFLPITGAEYKALKEAGEQ